MNDDREIAEAIESTIKGRLSGVDIVSVDVRPDVDADGDRILRVRVVFKHNKQRLDARLTSGLTRHLRSQIEERGERGFPILSFVSDADIRNAKAEAH